jgi:hypothetical protein
VSDREEVYERTRALEEEAENLRTSNDALRRENEELRKPPPEPPPPRPAPVPVPRRTLPPIGKGEAAELVRTALAPTWFAAGWALLFVLWLPWFVFLLWRFGHLGGGGLMIGVYGTVLGYPAVYFALLLGVRALEVGASRRWLASLPIHFDATAYQWSLGISRSSRDLTLTLHFVERPTDDEREEILAEVRKVRGVAFSKWEGPRLVVGSPTLRTARVGKRGKPFYDNVRVHRWFRRVVGRALVPVARSFAVEKMTVSG